MNLVIPDTLHESVACGNEATNPLAITVLANKGDSGPSSTASAGAAPGMPQGLKRKTPLKFGDMSDSGVILLGKKLKPDSGDGAKGVGRPGMGKGAPFPQQATSYFCASLNFGQAPVMVQTNRVFDELESS